MFGRLFGNKSKTDEIEEMVLILKGCGVLGKQVKMENGVAQQQIAFGRDWYSPRYLYRGYGDTKPDIYHESRFMHIYRAKKGPFHNKKPRGPGIRTKNQDGTPSGIITLSVIPIGESNYAWARMERNRLYPGHDNGWGEFNRISDKLKCKKTDRELLARWKIRTRSSLLSLSYAQINSLKCAEAYKKWKGEQTNDKYDDEDLTKIDDRKPGVYALKERAIRRLAKYESVLQENSRTIHTRKVDGLPLPSNILELMEKIKKLEQTIKDYDEDIRNADTYGRLYWYFVIRITKRADGSVNLDDISLPSKLSRKHDFDKNSFIDPLWDEDDLHAVLDGMLKDYLIEQMTPSETLTRRWDVIKEENVLESITHIDEVNKHENAKLMRTLAFARATQNGEGKKIRLPEDSYSQKAGVVIPKEYFETRDGQYVKSKDSFIPWTLDIE